MQPRPVDVGQALRCKSTEQFFYMSSTDLKETLISKIQETDDKALLDELSVLFELHEPDTLYD